MSSPDDIPGPSKPRAKKRSPRSSSSDSKSQASPPPTTSNGHGSGSGGTPNGERSPAGNQSPFAGRSPAGGLSPGLGPTNMRDRVLVANAMAIELSTSEQEDSTSSSSPQMNGHHHNDSGESDQKNGGSVNGDSRKSKKKKKKSRSRRERRISGDAALMGWTGGFPKLTAMASIDSSSDMEPQSPGELRALGRRGLRVFPRVEQQAETAAGPTDPAEMAEEQQQQQQQQEQQQSLASPSSPMMTSPVESFLSSNSDLIMTISTPPGREPEPEQQQNPEPEQQITLATVTSTNQTTTTTTTSNSNSNNNSNATGTATTSSPRTTASSMQETELDNQEKNMEMEQPAKAEDNQQPAKEEDKQQPAKADDKRQPAKGEDKQQPAEEEEKQQPAKADDKQQPAKAEDKQEPAEDENEVEKEEEIEPLVVAEDEVSSDFPLVSTSSLPPPEPEPASIPRSRKRSYSPTKKDAKLAKEEDAEKKKKKKEEETEVPLVESPKKMEDTDPPVSSRFAKRAKSLSTQISQPEQVRRTSRFSSQELLTEEQIMTDTQALPINKEPDAQIEAIPEPPPTTSALKLKATDEFYRLPFAYGWRREFVLPSTGNQKRRTGDVFFIAPNGRKLRSREDIVPLLEGELTIEHFCFQRQAQEAGPEHELVRRATPASASRRKSQHAVAQLQPAPLPVTGKRVSKPKVPKGASPPSEGWTATMAVKGNSRVLASSNGSSSAGTPGASISSRKRNFMSRQSSRTSSVMIAGCVHCQAPLQPTGSKQVSPRTNTCQNCLKIKREKERESEKREMVAEPQLEDADQDDDQDDDDIASAGSLLEVGEEIEVPGHHPPAQLFNNLGQRRSPKEQEVVVIGGRKAIAIKADPPRPRVKVVPRHPDLSSYEKIFNKRTQAKKSRHDLVESLGDAHNGCQVLMAIMKTMNLKERANMSRVCKTWAMVSRENAVWRSVSLRDTHIGNWVFCLRELARHRTRELDMMGVIMAKPQIRMTGDLRVLKALRILRTDTTDAEFLQLVFRHLPQLMEIRATCLSGTLSLSHLERTDDLRVLRIQMTETKATIGSLNSLAKLKHLTELSLRGVNNLARLNLLLLKDLTNLEVLSLGSCQDINGERLGKQVLPTLKALRSFRLENDHKGMAMFPVDEIMRGLSRAGGVRRLELVNVDVDGGFSVLLASCPSVTELLLTPKCMHNTANMTNAVMQAISDNAEQLLVFRLGLVTQLLSATGTLYKGTGKDVIPVQRPVPGVPASDHLNRCSADDNCQESDHDQCVAFLPVERLEAILHHMMPQAWLSVAKVAMCDTTKIKFLPRPEESSEENF